MEKDVFHLTNMNFNSKLPFIKTEPNSNGILNKDKIKSSNEVEDSKDKDKIISKNKSDLFLKTYSSNVSVTDTYRSTLYKTDKSYFINKVNNNKNYKIVKSDLLNHMLKNETKYSDLEKIEDYNRVVSYHQVRTTNQLDNDILMKKMRLNYLNCQIGESLAESYNFKKEKLQISEKFIDPCAKIEIMIEHAKHALSCYKAILKMNQNDKSLLLKHLENEYLYCKINEEHYKKYIIIKENSFRTFELQYKLRKDMEIYKTMLYIKTDKNIEDKKDNFRRLEYGVNKIIKLTEREEMKLKEIRNHKEKGHKKIKSIQIKNEKIFHANIELFRKNMEKIIFRQKFLYYTNGKDLEESLAIILNQNINFTSNFNFFNTQNYNLISINNEKRNIVNNDQKIAYGDIEDYPLLSENVNIVKNMVVLKEYNSNILYKKKNSEKLIIYVISFINKYSMILKTILENNLTDLILKSNENYDPFSNSNKLPNKFVPFNLKAFKIKIDGDYNIKDFFQFLNITNSFFRAFFYLYYSDLINVVKEKYYETLTNTGILSNTTLHRNIDSDFNNETMEEINKNQFVDIQSIEEKKVIEDKIKKLNEKKELLKTNKEIVIKTKDGKGIEKKKIQNDNLLKKLPKVDDILDKYLEKVSAKSEFLYSPQNKNRVSIKDFEIYKSKIRKELIECTNNLVRTEYVVSENRDKYSFSKYTVKQNRVRKAKQYKFEFKDFRSKRFDKMIKDSNNNGKNIENNIYKKSNDNDDSFIENKEDVKVVKSNLLMPIRFMKKKDDSEQIKIYERMNDLQNLNINLFKPTKRIGHYTVNNDFQRIYAEFKRKQ